MFVYIFSLILCVYTRVFTPFRSGDSNRIELKARLGAQQQNDGEPFGAQFQLRVTQSSLRAGHFKNQLTV